VLHDRAERLDFAEDRGLRSASPPGSNSNEISFSIFYGISQRFAGSGNLKKRFYGRNVGKANQLQPTGIVESNAVALARISAQTVLELAGDYGFCPNKARDPRFDFIVTDQKFDKHERRWPTTPSAQ
jgi:hypothetical protein